MKSHELTSITLRSGPDPNLKMCTAHTSTGKVRVELPAVPQCCWRAGAIAAGRQARASPLAGCSLESTLQAEQRRTAGVCHITRTLTTVPTVSSASTSPHRARHLPRAATCAVFGRRCRAPEPTISRWCTLAAQPEGSSGSLRASVLHAMSGAHWPAGTEKIPRAGPLRLVARVVLTVMEMRIRVQAHAKQSAARG